MSKRNRIVGFAAAVATAALTLGGTTAAMASSGPSAPALPKGAVHANTALLRHGHPEQFDILITNLNPDGNVDATGPVQFTGDTDNTVNPLLDVWQDGTGDNVFVLHQDLPLPTVDLNTCTVFFEQNGGNWSFVGGQGTEAGATGVGTYDLRAIFSFKEVVVANHAICGLQYFTPQQLRRLIERGSPRLPDVAMYSIAVQGTGKAALPHRI